MKLVITLKPKKTVTKINKESLTTKRSLILIGLSAACGGYLLFLAVLAPQQLAEATTAATDVVCNGCVGSGDIADSTIQSVDIRNGHVANADIATDAVTSGKILNGQVASVDIGTGQVGSVDIGTGQVASVDIGTGQVGSVDIGTGQVASVDIGTGQVATADIASGAIQLSLSRQTSDAALPPGAAAIVTVECPSGTILTGGGYSGGDPVIVTENLPADPDRWWVKAHNTSPDIHSSVTAYALCIDPTIP
jgi:hypothetical protein